MSSYTRYMPLIAAVALVGFVLLCPEHAHAMSPGGGGLPYETGLQRFVDSMLGPVATGMVLVGFLVGAWGFMTGGEMNMLVRSMLTMLISGSIMLAAKPFVQTMFGASFAAFMQ